MFEIACRSRMGVIKGGTFVRDSFIDNSLQVRCVNEILSMFDEAFVISGVGVKSHFYSHQFEMCNVRRH